MRRCVVADSDHGDGCSIGVLERLLELEPTYTIRYSVTPVEVWPSGVLVFELLTVAFGNDSGDSHA